MMTPRVARHPPTTRAQLQIACWQGLLPAEALTTLERERLVQDLWLDGWTDVEIAALTFMTTYTTGRIRARLGLAAHPARERATA